MFQGDPRKIRSDEAAARLREVGWQVHQAYERLHASKGDQHWQLSYSTATSITVWTQDVEVLLGRSLQVAAPVSIPLRAKQRAEAFAQYQEDTNIFHELGLLIIGKAIVGAPDKLREFAWLVAHDYDLDTGFETVTTSMKREMLDAAARIKRAIEN